MSVSNTHIHTHINTHPHTEEESLQGRLSYLLSHFSYHLGFVNSQWGGNAISGAAHSSLTSVQKKKKKRENGTPSFLQSITHDKVATPRGDVERKAYIVHPSSYFYLWQLYGDSDAEEILRLPFCACWEVPLSQ